MLWPPPPKAARLRGLEDSGRLLEFTVSPLSDKPVCFRYKTNLCFGPDNLCVKSRSFMLDWLIGFIRLWSYPSCVANSGVLCMKKASGWIYRTRPFISIYRVAINTTSRACVLHIASEFIYLFVFLCCPVFTTLAPNSPGCLRCHPSLSSSQSPDLPSARLACSFASKNCPRKPSLMTHLATAQSPFPVDMYWSVSAASYSLRRWRAQFRQEIITCLLFFRLQSHWHAGNTTSEILRAWKNPANPTFRVRKLNGQRAFCSAEIFVGSVSF